MERFRWDRVVSLAACTAVWAALISLLWNWTHKGGF